MKKKYLQSPKVKQVGKSLFYSTYPYCTTTNSSNIIRRGYFDNLRQYCAVEFMCDAESMSDVVEHKNIFKWTTTTVKHLDVVNLVGCRGRKDKQLVMIGYFFELCNKLILSRNYNVSKNPGFESILGVFNNTDN